MLQGPSRLHITLLMLLAWGIIFPVSLCAKNEDGDSSSAPLESTATIEGIREEFLSRVTELRSLARRKEAVITEYARKARFLKVVQSQAKGIETEISAIQSDTSGKDVVPATASRFSFLSTRQRHLSKLGTSGEFYMDLLVEEYDILSRLEELEAGYKAKAITKGAFASENRGLKEELFRLKTSQQLNSLEINLIEGLGAIEQKLIYLR